MKGITHFAAGLAAASLVPGAVEMAAQGSPILLVGGVAGVMPDTIDFKWSKFVEDYPFEVDPDPDDPDPQAIADRIAAAIDAAYEADGGPVGLMIHTTRVGADAWREITVTFDSEHQEIRVKIGPVVTTGQIPLGGTESTRGIATAKPRHPFHESYLDTLKVNIFSGPSWDLRKQGDKVHMNFIAWHRRGTHSLFFDACMVAICWGLFGDWRYGAAAGLAALAHQLEDQLGFMGCSFLWPLDHRRWRGLELWHSGDPWANFSSIWICMAILVWQLNRYHPEIPLDWSAPWFFGVWVVFPLSLIWIARRIWFQKPHRVKASLPRPSGEPQPCEDPEAETKDNLRIQDVLNEVGGSEGQP